MNDVFNEVSEELKQDKIISFFKKYGKAIAVLLIAIIIGVSGYNFFQSRLNSQYQAETEEIITILNSNPADKTNNEKMTDLQKLGEDKDFQLSYLAHLYILNGYGNKVSREQLETQIDAILNDSNAPKLYTDFAALLKAVSAMDGNNSAQAEEFLSIILHPQNPWYFSATELMGFNFLQQNQPDKAEPYFRTLIETAETPNLIRERAAQTLSVISAQKLNDSKE